MTPFRKHLTIVSGLRNKPAETPEPHGYIEPTWLTCVKPWDFGVAGPDSGVSADQLAVRHIGQDTRLPSLELTTAQVGARVAWRTPTQSLPQEGNPRAVFQKLFGQGDTDKERAAILHETGSILDRVKEQAAIMLWLTWAAIGALVCFFVAVIPGVSLDRVFTTPLFPTGWSGVLGAVPYALWWLVSIETVALASEEAHEPHIVIPRGLVLSQITLVALVILTWFFACAAAPYKETGAVVYPLPLVFQKVWGTGWLLKSFSAVAMAGLLKDFATLPNSARRWQSTRQS